MRQPVGIIVVISRAGNASVLAVLVEHDRDAEFDGPDSGPVNFQTQFAASLDSNLPNHTSQPFCSNQVCIFGAEHDQRDGFQDRRLSGPIDSRQTGPRSWQLRL